MTSDPDRDTEAILRRLELREPPAGLRERVLARASAARRAPVARPRAARVSLGRAVAAAVVLACGVVLAAIVARRGGSSAPSRVEVVPTPAALAAAPLATLEIEAPAWLAVGDVAEAVILARAPAGEGIAVALDLEASAGLEVEAGPPAALDLEAGEARRLTARVVARRTGSAVLRLRQSAGEAKSRAPASDVFERAIEVRSAEREVVLATSVVLEGAETRLTVIPDARALAMHEPVSLALRLAPGLAAEAELGLKSLIHAPYGCFEQTTAATYPSLLVLELARSAGRVDATLAEEARRFAEAGAERLRQFQLAGGGFTLHGDGPAVPWLTAVGLSELRALAGAIPIEPERIERATGALLGFQQADGSFKLAQGYLGDGAGELAATAYAATALEDAGADVARVERSLAWVERRAGEEKRTTYELALAAKALLRAPARADGRAPHAAVAEALAARIEARAEPRPDGSVAWPADPTLTDTRGVRAQIEVTALAAQVLAATGRMELARRAVASLFALRGAHDFGGTQATVQALEALRATRAGAPATGHIAATIWGLPAGDSYVELAGEDRLEEIALGAGDLPQSDLVRLAVDRGLALSFVGDGRVAAQIVVRGHVPVDAALASTETALEPPALRVTVARPATATAGTLQRWAVAVTNASSDWTRAPMVELDLPPGFTLAANGVLDRLVRGGELHAHELHLGRLALYLPDLAPGAVARIPVDVVAAFAGAFAGGTVDAYPYYRPEESATLALGAIAVESPRSSEASDRAAGPAAPPTAVAPVAPRQEPVAAAPAAVLDAPSRASETGDAVGDGSNTSRASKGAGGSSSRTADPSAKGELVIGWDTRLGPLALDVTKLPFGTTEMDRLVTRLLYAGLPDVAKDLASKPETARAHVFSIVGSGLWSDGSPITAQDVVASWTAAREHIAAGDVPPLADRRQLALAQEMRLTVLSSSRLRIDLDADWPDFEARLRCWPFLIARTTAPASASALVTSGSFTVRAVSESEIILTPRRQALFGRVRIVPVAPEAAEARAAASFIWGLADATATSKTESEGAVLFPVGPHLEAADARFADAIWDALRLATSGAGNAGVILLGTRTDIALPGGMPEVALVADCAAVAPFADALARSLSSLGVPARVESAANPAPGWMLHLTIGVDASPIMGVPDTALDGRRLVNGERTLGFVVGALTFSSVSPSPRWLDRFGYFGARTAETK